MSKRQTKRKWLIKGVRFNRVWYKWIHLFCHVQVIPKSLIQIQRNNRILSSSFVPNKFYARESCYSLTCEFLSGRVFHEDCCRLLPTGYSRYLCFTTFHSYIFIYLNITYIMHYQSTTSWTKKLKLHKTLIWTTYPLHNSLNTHIKAAYGSLGEIII